MQTCELCGWDTRSDTRVCSSCRRAGADEQETGALDDAQLLSAVLHAARDDRLPDADGTPTSHLTLADAPPERDGTQVVLREVDPDAKDAPAPGRSGRPGTPSIAASLIAALSTPSDLADDTTDGATITAHQDATDDTHDDATTTTEPEQVDDDTEEIVVATYDDAGGAASHAWDIGDGPAASEPAQDGDRASQVAEDPTDDDDAQATTQDDEAQATTQNDDAQATTQDFTDTDDDAQATTQVPADAPPDNAAPEPAATPSAGGARSSDDSDDEPKTLGQRLRAGFQEMGAWAAVAQMGLLLVALLCVFQVVVLLVVHQFLSQVQTQDAAADLLAAHARATNIMVPALVGCALAAVAFAAWHARRGAADDSVAVRQWFGMPLRLWSVAAVAGAVLGVVLLDASTTIEQARQTTLWAIAACALLGVVALLSPRAIVVTPENSPSSAAGGRDVERGEGERRAA